MCKPERGKLSIVWPLITPPPLQLRYILRILAAEMMDGMKTILGVLLGLTLLMAGCKKEDVVSIDPLPQDTTHYPGQYPVTMTITATSPLTFVAYDVNDSSNHNFFNVGSALVWSKTIMAKKGYKLQMNAMSASAITFKFEYYGRTYQDKITSSGVSASKLVCP